jgi:uncharacterized Ntn-hydrolase superfamily protein
VTYSIIARDPVSGRLGVAVQSHYFSVGTTVPWVAAGIGAVATQAFAEREYGSRALEHLRAKVPIADVVELVLAADDAREFRQLAIMDAAGAAVVHTGASCLPECGHIVGDGVSVQGNMLASKTVLTEMVRAYSESRKDFASRLCDALDAAEAVGGDIRGKQSAAILVSGDRADGLPDTDLRVEDADEPLAELRRLLELHRAYRNIGGAILGSGLLLHEHRADRPIDAELAGLTQAVRGLGRNPEALFWKAVLLGRAQRVDEACVCLREAIGLNPRLRTLVAALPAAGFLPASVVDGLTDESLGADTAKQVRPPSA